MSSCPDGPRDRASQNVTTVGTPNSFRRPWEAEMAVRTDESRATETVQIDEARLHAFLGRAVGDVGALGSAPLVLIGDQLGLYEAMADAGPITPAELARRTA